MPQSMKHLVGVKLDGLDDKIGHTKDFYFDDQEWVVRYVVMDTGSWLPGRKVLISRHAFSNLELTDGNLVVNLTRKHIEHSPSIESHKPVSRRFEEEYHKYYGWPGYWLGDSVCGIAGYPMIPPPITFHPFEPATTETSQHESYDNHLRSMQDVIGHHIKASDGMCGHVYDFMIDPETWKIPQLVIKTGHLFLNKEVDIPSDKIEYISWDQDTVFVDLTRDAIEQRPEHHLEVL